MPAATPEEIDAVEERLRGFLENSPSFLTDQRMVSFGSASSEFAQVVSNAYPNVRPSNERDERIAALMEKYGEAVNRVEGAEPQDLLVLATFGFIRV